MKDNLQQVSIQINDKSGKSNFSTKPNVIAATEYVIIKRAKEVYEAGIRHFGEDRLEGFLQEKEVLPSDVVIYFIGPLQSRKIKDVTSDVDYFHALDRLSLAKEINKRAKYKIKCLLQVNVSGGTSKHGIALEDVDQFIDDLKKYDKIEAVGLMMIAPLIDDEAYIRSLFKQLRLKKEEIQRLNLEYASCDGLSTGMSNDYLIAAEEGATFVRIGTKFVGEEERATWL